MSGIGAAIAGGIASAGVAAASGIGNTLVNYGANKDLQHDARVFNSAEAQKQRDWEQYMASTQYQRMRADMEAAGINPASMSGVSGQPSSVPSGASAQSSAPSFSSSTFGGLSEIANSALKGLFAKDRNAARILASEIRDNARHGYRMEEMQEKLDLDSKLADFKSSLASQRNSAKAADHLVALERKAELQEKVNDAKQSYQHKLDRLLKQDASYWDKKHLEDLELYKKRLGHKSYR